MKYIIDTSDYIYYILKYQEITMTSRQRIAYIKETERMVDPEKVAAVNRGSAMLRRLPRTLQRRIAASGAKNNSYMGFVVEPYAFFMSHEITDLSAARDQLPPDYEIVPSAMFTGTAPRPTVILGAFNVHTSVFWGSRVETYLIARNTRTGLLSWIIIDYQTNTNSYDPGQGFTGPNAARSVVTTSFRGEVIVDVENGADHRRLALTADLENGRMKKLNRDLWIEGNLSVDYGGELAADGGEPFGLIFDPGERARAMELPPGSPGLTVPAIRRPWFCCRESLSEIHLSGSAFRVPGEPEELTALAPG